MKFIVLAMLFVVGAFAVSTDHELNNRLFNGIRDITKNRNIKLTLSTDLERQVETFARNALLVDGKPEILKDIFKYVYLVERHNKYPNRKQMVDAALKFWEMDNDSRVVINDSTLKEVGCGTAFDDKHDIMICAFR